MSYSISIANETALPVFPSNDTPNYGDSVDILIDGNCTLSDYVILDNNTDITNNFSYITSIPVSKTATSCSGTSTYVLQAVGKTAENPATNTGNWWISGGSYADFYFDFSSLPSDADITSVTVKVAGGRESSTTDSTHVAKITLYSGGTQKSVSQEFTSISAQVITISNPGTWTRAELQNAKLRFEVAYYGGRVTGITWTVNYSWIGYKYTITSVSANHTINVRYNIIRTMYYRSNGEWVKVGTAYKKVNGNWVIMQLHQVFSSDSNYIKKDIS